MKVLITGVAGLLGANFARHLVSKGYKVIGVDNLSGGYKDFVTHDAIFYKADLIQSSAVNQIFEKEKPDYVFHFAAYAAVGLSPFIRNFNYMNNVIASANVVNACVNNNVKKLIFTSSMDVYGSVYEPPYTEDMTPVPEDPYGIAKYTVEQDIKAANRLFGLNYTIVRPHNVFGIYQNIWDKYRNVIGIWIRQTLSGQPITIYGDGTQVRSFSDVKYYMEPFEALMTVGDGETFNIGADSHTSIIAAAKKFAGVASSRGKEVTITHLQPRDEVKIAYCDHTKAKKILSFKDETNFEELIDKMFVWAESQPDRQLKLMSYEIEKKMYDFWKK